jgi:hypothetical protein
LFCFALPVFGFCSVLCAFWLVFSWGVFFFIKNVDFFGGKTLEEDPVYSTLLHGTYSFGRGVWAALSGTYDCGGRTTIDGVRSDDLESNWRLGATLALPVNRKNSIKLYASTGVRTRTGSDTDLVGVLWQYRWGSGL